MASLDLNNTGDYSHNSWCETQYCLILNVDICNEFLQFSNSLSILRYIRIQSHITVTLMRQEIAFAFTQQQDCVREVKFAQAFFELWSNLQMKNLKQQLH